MKLCKPTVYDGGVLVTLLIMNFVGHFQVKLGQLTSELQDQGNAIVVCVIDASRFGISLNTIFG